MTSTATVEQATVRRVPLGTILAELVNVCNRMDLVGLAADIPAVHAAMHRLAKDADVFDRAQPVVLAAASYLRGLSVSGETVNLTEAGLAADLADVGVCIRKAG